MLLPKFTIRNLLLLTLVSGGFFAILGAAVRGADWAAGLSVPVLVVAAGLLLQMGTYLLAYYLSALTAAPSRSDFASPFAENKPPEQLLPPQEQEW